jgi:transcriptional regulator with XRE-family HTH domain
VTSNPQPPELTSDYVAQQIRRWRRSRGLTAEQLAQRCAANGVPELTAQTISNIETGRRDANGRRRRLLSVEELLAFALSLNVAPVDLLVSSDLDDEPYSITPTVAVEASHARRWIEGQHPITWVIGVPDPTVREYGNKVNEFAAAMPPDRQANALREFLDKRNQWADEAARERERLKNIVTAEPDTGRDTSP